MSKGWQRVVGLLGGLALAGSAMGADAGTPEAVAMRTAAVSAVDQASVEPRQTDWLHAPKAAAGPSLGAFLDPDGRLNLPEGFIGSLDPSGFTLASKPGEAPRFASKTAIDDAARWDPQFGQAIGCNDAVFATAALPDGRIALGGAFTTCGNVVVNRVAIWNPATGAFQALGSGATNGVDSAALAVAIAGSDVYVGGNFLQAGGAPANRVARFNSTNQTWSSLGIGAANGLNSRVRALAIAGSDVFVGGDFIQAGGAAANFVARFNTTTQTWSSLGTGVANGVISEVTALAIAGTSVYVGGDFTQAGGAAANRVASFDTMTQSWSSLGSGTSNGVNNIVQVLATAGGDVYVGGNFSEAGGAAANYVARFNTTTQTWLSLGTGVANGVNSVVAALAIAGTSVYVGGDFTQAGGAAANRVASFDTMTQSWSSLGSGTTNGTSEFVTDLAIAGSDVFVCGRFALAGGAAASSVARFNTTTQTWSSLGSGAANGLSGGSLPEVNAVAVAGSDVYVGGDFTQAGGAAANGVARFNTATWTWSSLGAGAANGVRGRVLAIAIAGSDVYVGGNFLQAGGVGANRVARFNTSTQSWSTLGSGPANGMSGGPIQNVSALAVAGTDVYVGGSFTQAGGAAANNVARFDTTNQTWAPLGSEGANGVSEGVSALAVNGGDVYVGGFFNQAGGAAANRVARFNTMTQTWSSLGTGVANGVNGSVFSLAIAGSGVYVGGEFTQAGGAAANRVASFNIVTQSWSSLGIGAANGVDGGNLRVYALAIAGSDVYVGGHFTLAGGALANNVARFSTATRTWSSLGSGAANGVSGGVAPPVSALGIACTDDVGTRVDCNVSARARDLYVGGAFITAGPNVSLRIARYDIRRSTASSIFTSSGTSLTANTPITFTASVATTSFPAQPGTVEFLDFGTPIVPCANQTVVGGTDTRTATCNTAALRVGSHNISARYQGDVLNFIGTSDPVTIEVVPPSFSFSAATLPGATFNTPGYSSGTISVSTATGTGVLAPVSFQIVDPSLLPPGLTAAPVTNGILITGTPTQAGTFDFTVRATDSSTTSATGGAFSSDRQYTIVVAKAAQTITPITRVDAVPLDNGVAFADGDFAVQASASSGLAVVIDSLTPTVCEVGLPNATVRLLQLGTCTLRARQGGNTNFEPAPEVLRSFQVKATPDVIIDSSPNPSLLPVAASSPDAIVLTATVATPAGGAPSGTMRFLRAGNTIAGCAAQPVSGSGGVATATCTTSSLVRGANTITAQYSGDALNVAATSNVHTHTLNVVTSVGIATITPNPCVVGQGCTVAVAVAASPAAAGTPPGSVQVASSTGGSCTITLAAGGGSCALTATTAGTGTVTATYLGSPPWLASPAANQSHPFVATVDELFGNGFEPAAGASMPR